MIYKEKWELYNYEGDNGEETYDLVGIRGAESHKHVIGGFTGFDKKELALAEYIRALHNVHILKG